MTEAQARTTANVVLAAAAIGVAYYVLKRPPLRRKVWQAARAWAAGPLAAWAATEIRRAWDDSAQLRTSGSPGPRAELRQGPIASMPVSARSERQAGYDEAGLPPPAAHAERVRAGRA